MAKVLPFVDLDFDRKQLRRLRMNPMIEKYLGSIIRSAIAAGLGALGLFSDAGEVEKWSAAIGGFLIAAGWSMYEKYRSRKKLVTAMAMPTTSSEETVAAVIADGAAPSVTIPKNVVPKLTSV